MSTTTPNPLATAHKRAVRIGETLKVYLAATPEELAGFAPSIAREIRRALLRGETVTENGVTQWVNETVMYDSSKTGSAAYTWSGDRVKVQRVWVTRAADGTLTQKPGGTAWKEFGEMV